MAGKPQILAVVTSTRRYDTVGYRTGLWLGELTHFTDVASAAGCEVHIASVDGGEVPLDPESLAHDVLADSGTAERYADVDYMALLDETMPISDVDAPGYDAVYLAGGHGAMFDFPTSSALQRVVATLYDSGKVVSAVCHGPAGLLGVVLGSGEPLLRGRKVTGFSWTEEGLAGRDRAVPFNLQERLEAGSGEFVVAPEPFGACVVNDGRLVTGQNPASAAGVARVVVAELT